jgi:hypothetical protein
MSKGEADLSNEQSYRAFLLGTANPETERRIEEGILDGSIDPNLISMAEDDLIDDYAFGKLSAAVRQQFDARFLTIPERRRKVALAQLLVRQAADAQPGVLRMPSRETAPARPWRTFAAFAAAACLIAAILLGLQSVRLHKESQIAQSSQDEVTRLRSALAEEKAKTLSPFAPGSSVRGTGDKPSARVLLQPLTRDAQAEAVLRILAQDSTVSLSVEFPERFSGKVRESLVVLGSGRAVWTQEFIVPGSAPIAGNAVSLPAPLLVAGNYELTLEEAESDHKYTVIETYPFRVTR